MYILIVEDSRTQAEVLRDMLRRHGYEAVIAKDGKRAFELVRVRKPSLIISDVIMPVMDGYEVLQALKGDPGTADIPVVIMSAFQPDQERQNILELASELVGKPFDVEDFISHIESVIVREEGAEEQSQESETA